MAHALSPTADLQANIDPGQILHWFYIVDYSYMDNHVLLMPLSISFGSVFTQVRKLIQLVKGSTARTVVFATGLIVLMTGFLMLALLSQFAVVGQALVAVGVVVLVLLALDLLAGGTISDRISWL